MNIILDALKKDNEYMSEAMKEILKQQGFEK